MTYTKLDIVAEGNGFQYRIWSLDGEIICRGKVVATVQEAAMAGEQERTRIYNEH